ncbi:class I ribonucleotide reductase maintenance protein YfaE [Glaciecola sp. MH2013]|uniref:class I ribonucleotide reductase maintenance protein YfaE n=1 Tax=Glaciecola sp. MH2013 TaxID=2785524 RepID=UPI001E3B39B8|nr:class I ribonucleotide reductase maintenance protein YfaE [Glaciecola sp. MH2013]
MRVDGLHSVFSESDDKSLLEHLESNNIEVHYHCREGYCGACRTKLNEGNVDYHIDPLAFIDDDEILPCCCKPTSDIDITLY